jgi:hypothetical protein
MQFRKPSRPRFFCFIVFVISLFHQSLVLHVSDFEFLLTWIALGSEAAQGTLFLFFYSQLQAFPL